MYVTCDLRTTYRCRGEDDVEDTILADPPSHAAATSWAVTVQARRWVLACDIMRALHGVTPGIQGLSRRLTATTVLLYPRWCRQSSCALPKPVRRQYLRYVPHLQLATAP